MGPRHSGGGAEAGGAGGASAVAEGARIRPARPEDVPSIGRLIGRFAARELMLPKTPERLAKTIGEFFVAGDAEGEVIGCAALRVYTPQMAELTSLAVDERAQRAGLGGRLIDTVEAEARRQGISVLFALTLREAVFHRLGYRTVAKETFPLKVWADCHGCPKLERCDEVAVVRELD